MSSISGFLAQNLDIFWQFTGFANAVPEHFVMLLIGILFIFLAIKYEFEPLLLIPIGFGMLIGNIPSRKVTNWAYTSKAQFSILYTKEYDKAGIHLLFS